LSEDGGYVIAGSTLVDDETHYDAWIIKTDADGVIVWDNMFGNEESDMTYSIIRIDDGYVISGITHGICYDMWLFKIDFEGNLIWENSFNYYANENPISLKQTADGGFILSGFTEVVEPEGNYFDVYFVKTDQDGNLVWDSTYHFNFMDVANAILQTDDGGYLAAGVSIYENANEKPLIIKLDENGNMEWNNILDIEGSAWSILPSENDGYLVAGYTSPLELDDRDVLLFKIDDNGNLIWETTFGGDEEDISRCIKKTGNDGFVLCGYTESFGAGNKDVYLIRLAVETIVNENELNDIPSRYIINNYPNPMQSQTTISFSIQEQNTIDLSIYNIKGQLVKTLINDNREKGTHSIIWEGTDDNGKSVSSGIYYYKLNVDREDVAVRKCVIIR